MPVLFLSQIGLADFLGYFKGYKLGLEYMSHRQEVGVDYTTSGSNAAGCKRLSSSTQRCSVDTVSSLYSGYGVFLSQPFKAKGDFYFNADLGFAFRYLNGGMNEARAHKEALKGLPLVEVSYELVTFTIKPYIQIGWTPKGALPDFLLSFGPAYQVAFGEVSFNNTAKNVVILSGSDLLFGFVETEIIFLYLKGGYLSLFSSREVTGDDEGSPFYPEDIDGIKDSRARFRSSSSGAFFNFGLRFLTWLP